MLKKYYGNTLEEAREKARKELGIEKIAVLETVPAKDGFLACITVLAHNAQKNNDTDKTENYNRNYSRSDLFPRGLQKIKNFVTGPGDDKITTKGETSSPSAFADRKGAIADDMKKGNITNKYPAPQQRMEPAPKNLPKTRQNGYNKTLVKTRTEQKGSICLDGKEESEFEKLFKKNGSASANGKNPELLREMEKLNQRIGHLEALLSRHILSTNLDYVTHPAFQQLLDAGIPATSISHWFREILTEGIDPRHDSRLFVRRLARILKRQFPNGVDSNYPGKQFSTFYGTSGAGKTTLIMKLASRVKKSNCNKIAFITLYKEGEESYTTLQLYADHHDIDHYHIELNEKLESRLNQFEKYEQVFIDTPALSLQTDKIINEASAVHNVMKQLPEFESHLVINASVHDAFFEEEYLSNYPLKPDFLAVTHLDAVPAWGHLLTLFNTIESTPHFLTNGPQVQSNIKIYSPEWFANQILTDLNTQQDQT